MNENQLSSFLKKKKKKSNIPISFMQILTLL